MVTVFVVAVIKALANLACSVPNTGLSIGEVEEEVSKMRLLQVELSLENNYENLLRKQRTLKIKDDSGKALCAYCSQEKLEHCSVNRCSTSALSRTFRSVDAEEQQRIEQALMLIEELMTL